jgi:hypothetical protein
MPLISVWAAATLRFCRQFFERNAIHDAVQVRRMAAQREARCYRTLLYASAILMLGGLVLTGPHLRSRAPALRRHAEPGHMLAALSSRLISAGTRRVEACWATRWTRSHGASGPATPIDCLRQGSSTVGARLARLGQKAGRKARWPSQRSVP